MKHTYYKLFLLITLLVLTIPTSHTFAARITLLAPKQALANNQPIVVQLLLDGENDVLSGVAGDISFPSDMFSIGTISVENSVVSLWGEEPHVVDEKNIDNRTRIRFEGVFPGGYDGVRSPYYQGKKPGNLLYLTLIPKHEGEGSIIVDNMTLNSYDSDASPLPVTSLVHLISVPMLLPKGVFVETPRERVTSQTLSAFITRDPLVENNAWYLVVHDQEPKSTVEKMRVAEVETSNPLDVREVQWHEAKSPYVLYRQQRDAFVHVQLLYSNNTYAFLTLPPVENSTSISYISRILVSVIIVLSLLYVYGIRRTTFFKKKL